jgi:hypothetical protein
MTHITEALKRYSGYTRFVAPIWSAYVGWVDAHPKTTALILVGLAVVAAL